jgi:uncharacterized protein involved in type VI secretion and phage assembly
VDLQGGGLALGMIQAKGSSTNPFLKVGTKAAIKAIKTDNSGKVDYGEYIITSITHNCDNLMNYQNHFSGTPSSAKVPEYTNPLAYPKTNAQSAVIKDNNDPEKIGRVKVTFPWQGNEESPWVRVSTPHAGDKKGFYFIPEIGEEVLVGFEDGDAERPYVIGSMFNGKEKPDPALVNSSNEIKYIRTVGGNTIEITDTDGKEEISIYQKNDKNGRNHITLTSAGSSSGDNLRIFTAGDLIIEAKSIKINAQQDINLSADGGKLDMKAGTDVKLEGSSSVSVKANADLKMEGLNVSNKAQVELKNEGATVSVSGSAMTEIKGAMVKIN